MKQKKEERYTKWEIIFQDTEKTKHRKNKLIFQEAQQRKQFFFCRSQKKITFLLHKEFDVKKHGENKEQKKEI